MNPYAMATDKAQHKYLGKMRQIHFDSVLFSSRFWEMSIVSIDLDPESGSHERSANFMSN